MNDSRYAPNSAITAARSEFTRALLTSQVLDEVLQLHLPLGFDVGAVHVRVEEDDGKGQDKDGVGVSELTHHARVADAVTLTASMKRRKEGEERGGEKKSTNERMRQTNNKRV